jgi:hypothetical protein
VAGGFFGDVYYRAGIEFIQPVSVFYGLGYVDSVCAYCVLLLLFNAEGRKVCKAKHLCTILVG